MGVGGGIVESYTEQVNLECIQVLMGPRLSATPNANRQDFMECSELLVNSVALTRGSGQGTRTRTQVAVKLSSNTHVTVSHSQHSVGRMSAQDLL